MKKLFLASSFMDVADLFSDSEKDLCGKTVTFITTASKVEKVVFYVKTGRQALEKMGLTVEELDISIVPADEISTIIKKNDIIYITGGNTYFLLQELKRTGADKMIIEAVNSGKIYIGESAGAIVASKNVEYAKEMDSIKKAPDLTDFDALGLSDFYTVPHYINPPFQRAAQKIIDTFSSTLKLMPISNNDAILVCDNEVTIKSN